MSRSVRDAMTEGPRTVRRDSPLVDAARIMRDEDVGVVPVVDGERILGMLTDRDITLSVVAEGKDPRSTNAEEIASSELVTADPQQARRDPRASRCRTTCKRRANRRGGGGNLQVRLARKRARADKGG